MSTSPYSYWPIVDRPGFKWPDDKAFAVYVGVNVETWAPEGPATPLVGFTAGLPHDPLNQGWRDYGNRVGVWRLMDILDDLDLRATVLLNADVCAEYPEVVAAGVDREWSYLAHGRNSSQLWTGLSEDEERGLLKGIVEDLSAAVGSPPSGWLGPGLSETENTPRLLAEFGLTYTLDWCADDQPFPIDAGGRPFISVPYSIEINDLTSQLILSAAGYVRRA